MQRQWYPTSHLLLLFVAYLIWYALGGNHLTQCSMECCIHFEKGGSECDPVLTFSQKSTGATQQYTCEWLQRQDSVGCEVATRLATNVGDSLLFPSNYGYHRKCYQLYMNKKNLDTAKRRTTVIDSRPQKRTRQSEVGLGRVVQNSASVFGSKCIICNKNKYVKDKKSGAWRQECLKTCQSKTVEAAIKLAARTENCEQVLLIVEGEDLIAKEAKYHTSCFSSLTYFPTKTVQTASEHYTKFCNEVIEQRIIKDGEIVRISRLADIYSEYYREAIDDASVCTISSGNLKRKLKKSHPDLIYFRIKEVANCELVCSRCSNNAMSVETVTSSDESTCADSSYDPVPLVDVTNNENRDLFLSSQVLKNAIDKAPKLIIPNPPLAQDLQLDSAEKITPNQLFNFLAWVTTLSSEPLDGDSNQRG